VTYCEEHSYEEAKSWSDDFHMARILVCMMASAHDTRRSKKDWTHWCRTGYTPQAMVRSRSQPLYLLCGVVASGMSGTRRR
jgi:hypothetical protein